MRKVYAIITGIFLTLLFTTCKQFTANIDDYLGYWAAEVSPMDYSIDKPHRTTADGSMCVPSANDVTLTIKLLNPKNFTLITPASPADAGKVIRFQGLSSQPEYGTDYILKQTAPDILRLTYKTAFLRTHECSNGDIGPEIILSADDGRVFKKEFSLNLKVDTAPVLENAGIAKTQVGSEWYYTLLFRVKDMDATITGSSVHKDITALNVTAGGGTPVDIPLTFNSSNTDFATRENLLGAANDIDTGSPIAHENWVIRLKTDVKVGEAEKEYAVSIKDAQGLSSAVIRTSTKKNKLPDVQLFNGSTSSAPEITAITESAPVSFPGITEKTLTAKALDGALITGVAYKQNGSDWNQAFTVSGTTPVSIYLPAIDASENEALYKITLKASLTGYDDSNEKTFFVKLLRQELPVLKIKQDFTGTDNALHSISAAAKGYVTEDIIPDAENYKTATTPLVIYNSSNAAKLSLTPRAGSGATVKYKLNDGIELTTAEEIAINGANKLEVWAERGGILGPRTVLYVTVKNGITDYSALKNVIQNAPSTREIGIDIDNDLNHSVGACEITVSNGKKLVLRSNTPSARTINVSNCGRIFKISGGAELTLDHIELKNGKADTGGAVYVEDGTLTLSGLTVITPSTGGDVNTPGKNDVYLKNGKKINLTGHLTAAGTVARITPETYNETVQVLDGTVTAGAAPNQNYTRFTVTQPDDGFLWKVKNDGTLQAIPNTINNSDEKAWKKLQDTVRNLPEGGTITISGLIHATNEGTAGVDANWGEIVIDKDLTIKGKTGAGSNILDANSSVLGADAHRIFNVANGKKLTLENLTLKNGQCSGSTENGGAVYTKGGSVEMTLCTLIGNTANRGGAVYAEKDGSTAATVTLKGCTIGGTEAGSANVANTGADREGGGIYIGEGCILILEDSGATGCTVKGNNALRGGGIYVAGTAEIKGTSKILNNTADHFGGGIHSEGTLTLSGDALIKGNSASDHSALGGGVYVGNGTFTMSDRATVTPSTGENADKPRENDVYLNSATKIKVDGTLTPQGGTAARITPDSYAITTQVLTGSITAGTSPNQNYTKFTVTPQTLSDGKILYWEVDAAGKLMRIVDGTKYPNSAWKALKDAVDNATAGETIFIRETVQATADTSTVTGNSGDITINKNLTIKGESETSIGILDANKDTGSKPKHRIFKVESGKTLTIQNLTLTGGIAEGTGAAGIGGAIYASGATVNITGCTLKGNTAKTGGAICAEKDGSTGSTVTVTGGTIGGTGTNDANKATGTGSDNGFGGAIYAKGATININGCTLTGNEAKNGGGVYMEGGNCTLNGSLKNNKTTELASSSGGSIYLKNGTLTMKTGAEISGSEASVSGGGVYISARDGGTASFTMEGGTISGCKVSSASPVDGGGVCVEVAQGSTGTANFIMQGGSITGCKAASGGLTGSPSGGGVCVKNGATFTMTGGSITGCKAVINDNAGNPEAQGGGVHIDEHSTFNMSGTSSITGCTAESSDSSPGGTPSFHGGGVYVGNGTFTMSDRAAVTPSTGENADKPRQNDVYLPTGNKIDFANNNLNPQGDIAARITPEAYGNYVVLRGGTTAMEHNHTKFKVTPQDLGSGNTQEWKINDSGWLKKK